MSRESLVMLLGLAVIFIPTFGVPSEWKSYGLLGVGILLCLLGYSLRRSMYLRMIDRGDGERGTDAFVEYTGTASRTTRENEHESADT